MLGLIDWSVVVCEFLQCHVSDRLLEERDYCFAFTQRDVAKERRNVFD